jgi:F-type H+-transporting ATPase subunit b
MFAVRATGPSRLAPIAIRDAERGAGPLSHQPRYSTALACRKANPRGGAAALLVSVALAVLLGASEAFGAEGGLVLTPDFARTLPFLLVVFVLLIYPVNVLLFRPIFKVLELRDQKIAGSRESAERVGREADEILERYERSLQQAREEAEAERKQSLEAVRSQQVASTGDARASAEQEVSRTREEVDRALTAARESLRSQAEDLANEAAARILGRRLS